MLLQCQLKPNHVAQRQAVARIAGLQQPQTRLSSVPAAVVRSVQLSAAKGFGTVKPQRQPEKSAPATPPPPCPCDSGKAYKNCCRRFHEGKEVAGTAEDALRARFAAFPKGQLQYLLDTTHPGYHSYHYNKADAAEDLKRDMTAGINSFTYAGLKVVEREAGVSEDEAFISYEYLSTKRENASSAQGWDRTAEKARFVRVDGVWLFIDYQRATFSADIISAAATPLAPAT